MDGRHAINGICDTKEILVEIGYCVICLKQFLSAGHWWESDAGMPVKANARVRRTDNSPGSKQNDRICLRYIAFSLMQQVFHGILANFGRLLSKPDPISFSYKKMVLLIRKYNIVSTTTCGFTALGAKPALQVGEFVVAEFRFLYVETSPTSSVNGSLSLISNLMLLLRSFQSTSTGLTQAADSF
jgi:hypothetical protein